MNDCPLNDIIVNVLLIDINDRFRIFKYSTSSMKINYEASLAIFINIKIAYSISNLFITFIIAGLDLRFIQAHAFSMI
jgi:hypothetical protein